MLTLLLACSADRSTAPIAPSGLRDLLALASTNGTADTGSGIVQGEPLSVCINEFMPANVVSTQDEAGLASDWIELYNPTDQDVALDGWSITDDPTEPHKHVLLGGLVLEAGGFLLLWPDGAPERGPAHLDFALSNDGEAVALFAPDGTGSIVRYGPVISDHAVSRITDCCFDESAGCFAHQFAGTPNASNGE